MRNICYNYLPKDLTGSHFAAFAYPHDADLDCKIIEGNNLNAENIDMSEPALSVSEHTAEDHGTQPWPCLFCGPENIPGQMPNMPRAAESNLLLMFLMVLLPFVNTCCLLSAACYLFLFFNTNKTEII